MAGSRERPAVHDPDETTGLAERLYLACRPDGGGGDVRFEARELDGRPVVLAYTSLEHFLAGCGPDQPWILLPTPRLAELGSTRPADGLGAAAHRFGVLLDAPLPPAERGTAAGPAAEESRWDDPESADWTTLHLASRPFTPGDEQAQLELQPMVGGHLAVMAYTSQAALETGCGPHQASVRLPAGLLAEARRQAGADTICLDTPLPAHLRHPSGGGNG